MICPLLEPYGLVLDGCEAVRLVRDFDLRLIRGSLGWLGEVDLQWQQGHIVVSTGDIAKWPVRVPKSTFGGAGGRTGSCACGGDGCAGGACTRAAGACR